MQYVLGRAGLTAKNGCFRCKKSIQKWSNLKLPIADRLTVEEIVGLGKEALEVLGHNPREDTRSTLFTNLHHTHFGQIQPPLFSSVVQETIPPCGLHLILAIHRMFWKVIHSVSKTRKQEEHVAKALRMIGCNYLGFQLQSYFQSEGKHYDGSETMKMTRFNGFKATCRIGLSEFA